MSDDFYLRYYVGHRGKFGHGECAGALAAHPALRWGAPGLLMGRAAGAPAMQPGALAWMGRSLRDAVGPCLRARRVPGVRVPARWTGELVLARWRAAGAEAGPLLAQMRYANNSNYKNDEIITRETFVSPAVLDELKRIVEDSEVRPDRGLVGGGGRQQGRGGSYRRE